MLSNHIKHITSETIIGVWKHGEVGKAVNRLLNFGEEYTITEMSPDGLVLRTSKTLGRDIRMRCIEILGIITHTYEIRNKYGELVLRYTPGGERTNTRIH